MKFMLNESKREYYIAVIHIDDEDGTWVKIEAPNPESAVDYLLEVMKSENPDATYIRVDIDNTHKEWNKATNEDAEDVELDTPEQKYSSAKTSINSTKLPAIFGLVDFEQGTINLDYGGGKFDNATEALSERGVTNLIYDPFNRSKEHNDKVLSTVRENHGADTITCSNVLNVIAEPVVRLSVISNIRKLLKSTGVAYFTVYEGSGSGEGKETSSGYQLNRKTADYIQEIAQVFPNTQRRGKLIIAKY